jgi:cobyrinic acid a,c-diamide synthase
MREAVATFARSGRPIYAECGGLMYLTRAIRTRAGRAYPMVGLYPCEAVMADRLEAIGYVEVALEADTPIGPAGTRFRGHQFRYSRLTEPDGPVALAYSVRRRGSDEPHREGYRAGDNVLASYVHAHWASNPRVAEAFVASCRGAVVEPPPTVELSRK